MLLIMALPFILIMAATIYMAHKVTEPIVWLAQFARSSVRNAKKLPPIRTSHWIWEADLLTKTVLNSLKTMQDQNERLTDSTRKDPLTGLQNRRALNEYWLYSISPSILFRCSYWISTGLSRSMTRTVIKPGMKC